MGISSYGIVSTVSFMVNEWGNIDPQAYHMLSPILEIVDEHMKNLCDQMSLANARLLWYALSREVESGEAQYMLTRQIDVRRKLRKEATNAK